MTDELRRFTTFTLLINEEADGLLQAGCEKTMQDVNTPLICTPEITRVTTRIITRDKRDARDERRI